MFLSLRASLLAGALVATDVPAHSEPIAIAVALRQGGENSPRIGQAKAQAQAAEARARQAGVWRGPSQGQGGTCGLCMADCVGRAGHASRR
jgi:outer membrane protein, heavy metal efflux system